VIDPNALPTPSCPHCLRTPIDQGDFAVCPACGPIELADLVDFIDARQAEDVEYMLACDADREVA
jgi:hypothetical protein